MNFSQTYLLSRSHSFGRSRPQLHLHISSIHSRMFLFYTCDLIVKSSCNNYILCCIHRTVLSFDPRPAETAFLRPITVINCDYRWPEALKSHDVVTICIFNTRTHFGEKLRNDKYRRKFDIMDKNCDWKGVESLFHKPI